VRHHHLKGRWLHTRISGTLEEALKREARRRRQPVSLLVRNVLEGALDLVEDIVETSLGAAERVRSRPATGTAHRDVYGWQELVLNLAASCDRCGVELATGSQAWRGLSDRPRPPVFLCDPCLRRLRRPAEQSEEEPR
jgi:hypothetical protein